LGYHPDHQCTGKRTLDAVHFDCGLSRLWPDAGPAWTIKQFYMWGFESYSTYFPMTTQSLNKKIEALLQHKTQFPDPTEVETIVTLLVTEKIFDGDNLGGESCCRGEATSSICGRIYPILLINCFQLFMLFD
jgi:LmbE family N-acetylglucosaminyl deacetylase